jgi:hypothetical protein
MDHGKGEGSAHFPGSRVRGLGAILLALGLLALVYKGFSYTKETHGAKLGPIELEVREKERVDIPVAVGVVAIVAGGVLLAMGGRKR